MECIAVDWSGAATGAAQHIWVARATGGVLHALYPPGSRAAVLQFLLDRRLESAPCVVGLDFAFAFPAWFAAERGWRDGPAQWAAVRDDGERWLRDCAPPFWGRPGRPRPHAAPDGLRDCERRQVPGARSVFQIGGAGSVGTGSIRGMPMLLTLRTAGWSVWPFDPAGTHTVAEIYPRCFTGAVVKRSGTARAAHLARHFPEQARDLCALMCGSEDAFDAGVSAIAMSRGAVQETLQAPRDASLRLEGAILMPPVSAGRGR
ncbi:MAG: hypothetical protein IT355_15720 [Gemmatimonadaceae bacterium]|nr:hypothetical protein [Gemmatimonadaceae bacterium]